MAAYRRVYDSRHLQADCKGPGSAAEPYALQSSMGCLYPFLQLLLYRFAAYVRELSQRKHSNTRVVGRLMV